MYHNNFPTIFELSLTDGTLKSSVMKTTLSINFVDRPIMAQLGDSDTQVIISYPDDAATNMVIWSTSTSSILSTHDDVVGSKIKGIISSKSNGMIYLASGESGGGSSLNLYRFYYHDPNQRSSALSGSLTFSTTSSYTYSPDSSVSISPSAPLPLTDITPTVSTETVEQSSNTTGNIVYRNGNDQFHSVQSGFSGNLTFDYFCHKSTNFTSTTLYEVTSGVSSWISIDTGYTYLTVNAPIVNTTANYTFGISYVDVTINITSESIIAVYLCNVSNCDTCSYSTRDTQ